MGHVEKGQSCHECYEINQSADIARFREGETTYPTGLARAGAATEMARRSVAKREVRIVLIWEVQLNVESNSGCNAR